jgi:hypothetical protein
MKRAVLIALVAALVVAPAAAYAQAQELPLPTVLFAQQNALPYFGWFPPDDPGPGFRGWGEPPAPPSPFSALQALGVYDHQGAESYFTH